MMKSLLTFCAAACIGLSPAAAGSFYDGNGLLSRLTGNGAEIAHATGYVMGVIDAQSDALYCPPATVTAGQMRDVVRAYLQATPTRRHMQAEFLIAEIFKTVWPCTDNRPIRPTL